MTGGPHVFKRLPPIRHFKLSLFAHAVSLMSISAISLLSVCFALHRAVVQETLLSMLAIWGLLFVYFWILLYLGARFDRGLAELKKEYVSMDGIKGIGDGIVQFIGTYPSSQGIALACKEGCLVFLLQFILVAFIIFLAPFLIWFGVNAVVIVFLSVFLSIYWIFRRGLLLVMVNAKRCKGDRAKSLYIAGLHSFVYALFLGVVVFVTECMVRLLCH